MPTTVYREQKRGRAVERAAREFLPKASEALAAELAAAGADEPGMPDGEELQRYAAKALAKAREAMNAADRAHREAMHRLPELRARRDDLVGETYRLVGAVRQALEGAYGRKPAAKVLGVTGPTPREPERLRTVVQVAARQLGDSKVALPELGVAGLAPDRAALAATLGRAHERFAEVLDELGDLERRVQALAQARDDAKARFRRFYVGWGRVLDGLYVVADQRELARRLRPTEPAKAAAGAERGEEMDRVDEVDEVDAEDGEDAARPRGVPGTGGGPDAAGFVHSVHPVQSPEPAAPDPACIIGAERLEENPCDSAVSALSVPPSSSVPSPPRASPPRSTRRS